MEGKDKFNPCPTVCNICGGTVVYGKMEEFGLEPYQSGYCYHCESCGAYVGTHKNRKKEALGILAYGDTRYLRSICHQKMDEAYYSRNGRRIAYHVLARELGLTKDECHFGHMERDMLERSFAIMSNWKPNQFR